MQSPLLAAMGQSAFAERIRPMSTPASAPRFSATHSPVSRRHPPAAVSGGPPDARDRDQEIARLVGLWPAEIADVSPNGRAHLIGKLKQVLKAERLRGRAGHWTYDLARHAALLGVLRRERAALAALRSKASAAHNGVTHPQKENARADRPARSISRQCSDRSPGR